MEAEPQDLDLGLGPRSQMLKCPRKGDPAVSWQNVHLESRNSRENKRTLLILLLFVESHHDCLFYENYGKVESPGSRDHIKCFLLMKQ